MNVNSAWAVLALLCVCCVLWCGGAWGVAAMIFIIAGCAALIALRRGPSSPSYPYPYPYRSPDPSHCKAAMPMAEKGWKWSERWSDCSNFATSFMFGMALSFSLMAGWGDPQMERCRPPVPEFATCVVRRVTITTLDYKVDELGPALEPWPHLALVGVKRIEITVLICR